MKSLTYFRKDAVVVLPEGMPEMTGYMGPRSISLRSVQLPYGLLVDDRGWTITLPGRVELGKNVSALLQHDGLRALKPKALAVKHNKHSSRVTIPEEPRRGFEVPLAEDDRAKQATRDMLQKFDAWHGRYLRSAGRRKAKERGITVDGTFRMTRSMARTMARR